MYLVTSSLYYWCFDEVFIIQRLRIDCKVVDLINLRTGKNFGFSLSVAFGRFFICCRLKFSLKLVIQFGVLLLDFSADEFAILEICFPVSMVDHKITQ